jgi:hypothetical protein
LRRTGINLRRISDGALSRRHHFAEHRAADILPNVPLKIEKRMAWTGFATDLTLQDVVGPEYPAPAAVHQASTAAAHEHPSKANQKSSLLFDLVRAFPGLSVGAVSLVLTIGGLSGYHWVKYNTDLIIPAPLEQKEVVVACTPPPATTTNDPRELTLFGQPLRTVSRSALVAAAKANCALLEESTDTSDNFDVSRLGIDASGLTIEYAQGRVVSAQYTAGDPGTPDDDLRKQLVDKYGLPKTFSGSYHDDPAGFLEHPLGPGTYTWPFRGNMELVYKNPEYPESQIHARTLTYQNAQLVAEQMRKQQLLDAAQQKADAKREQAKQNLY